MFHLLFLLMLMVILFKSYDNYDKNDAIILKLAHLHCTLNTLLGIYFIYLSYSTGSRDSMWEILYSGSWFTGINYFLLYFTFRMSNDYWR
jgi:hypothetical protein